MRDHDQPTGRSSHCRDGERRPPRPLLRSPAVDDHRLIRLASWFDPLLHSHEPIDDAVHHSHPFAQPYSFCGLLRLPPQSIIGVTFPPPGQHRRQPRDCGRSHLVTPGSPQCSRPTGVHAALSGMCIRPRYLWRGRLHDPGRLLRHRQRPFHDRLRRAAWRDALIRQLQRSLAGERLEPRLVGSPLLVRRDRRPDHRRCAWQQHLPPDHGPLRIRPLSRSPGTPSSRSINERRPEWPNGWQPCANHMHPRGRRGSLAVKRQILSDRKLTATSYRSLLGGCKPCPEGQSRNSQADRGIRILGRRPVDQRAKVNPGSPGPLPISLKLKPLPTPVIRPTIAGPLSLTSVSNPSPAVYWPENERVLPLTVAVQVKWPSDLSVSSTVAPPAPFAFQVPVRSLGGGDEVDEVSDWAGSGFGGGLPV